MRKFILFFVAVLISWMSFAQLHIGILASQSGGVAPQTKFQIGGGIARGYEKDMNESNLQDIFMHPDGSKYWTIGATCDCIEEYTTSNPYRIEGSTVGTEYSVSANGGESIPTGLEFSADGTVMLVVGLATDAILRYDLGTAYTLATASYTSSSGSLGAGGLYNLALNNDGTQVQVCYNNTSQYVYTMSTAYDPTTLSALIDSETISGVKFSNFGFNGDGTQAWGSNENSGIVYTWDLSTPYDWINTRSNEQTVQSVYYSNMRAMEMSPSNFTNFIVGGAGSNVEAKQYWFIDDMTFGSELITNADFSASGSWTTGAGWTIAGTGEAVLTSAAGNQILKAGGGANLTNGNAYVIRLNITAETGTGTNPITLSNIVEDQNLIVSDWYFYTENINTGTSQILQTYGRDSDTMTVDYFGVKQYIP